MSDELIEAVARRLAEVHTQTLVGFYNQPDLEPTDTTLRLHVVEKALARECIRLMRWTLTCAAEVTRQIGPEAKEVPIAIWEQWAHILETGPLTLPPDDWQP